MGSKGLLKESATPDGKHEMGIPKGNIPFGGGLGVSPISLLYPPKIGG